MLCAVYKSIRKSQTYLFVAKRDDFEPVPDPLLAQFGPPQLISVLNLKQDAQLAMTDANTVIEEIQKKGFYLQLPPPPVDYLKEHKGWLDKKDAAHSHKIVDSETIDSEVFNETN